MQKQYWFENNPFTDDYDKYLDMIYNPEIAAEMLKGREETFLIDKWNGRDDIDCYVIKDGEIVTKDIVESYRQYLLQSKSEKEAEDIIADIFDNVRENSKFWNWFDKTYGDNLTYIQIYKPGTKI